ncbi:hypothetical protein [Pseudomonas sp. C9-3]|uniref:hypothetical protein n=1 Tax=Pseudomonas sp. C9-3 TaxID=3078264 RepID=UPI0028E6F3DC|nr:hypothetical protein [Pseudomonas sp. C9-3]
MFWNANSVVVTAQDPLQVSLVKLAMDASFPKYLDVANIFFDGVQRIDIPNYYGENDFLLMYADRYMLRFRHFKTSRRHQHEYRLHLFKEQGGIHVKITIIGIDNWEYEGLMMRFLSKNEQEATAAMLPDSACRISVSVALAESDLGARLGLFK